MVGSTQSEAGVLVLRGDVAAPPGELGEPWKILVVDDDDEVHALTRLVLRHVRFRQRRLQLIEAVSAAEARLLLERHPDIALALVDVVMETPHAGLELVRHIREVLGNRAIRLILRTGQPAFSPWTFEPSVAYTEVSVDGLAMPWFRPHTVLQLPPTAHRFSVEFAALDLSAPPLHRYRYRLLRFDDEWILTDADHRVATYSTLWPGRYELQLSGSNRLGQWSTRPLSLVVEVQPAFWQTVWFLLLMLLLLGSLLDLRREASL